MEDKIKQIMADVFLVDENQINENTAPGNLQQWDSLGQLNLIMSLEEEFGIMLSDDQVAEMLNYRSVVEITKEALDKKVI